MGIIEIKSIDELNYDVCEFVLRNRIHDAAIHCTSQDVLNGLSLYLTEIGIPWDMESKAYGISLSNEFISSSTKTNLFIAINEPPAIPDWNSNGVVFLLKDVEQEMLSKLSVNPDSFDIDKVPIHLQNEEIRKMFLRTFLIAEKEIDIISPWMNFSVVNNSLIHLMKCALQRGVQIRIIYGLNPSSDEYNQIRSERSDQVASRLKECFNEFGKAFTVSRDNIHYKLVLCDEKYKLEGGFNYLSFTGDYTDPNTRKEGSPFGRDVDEIRFLRKEYFKHDSVG